MSSLKRREQWSLRNNLIIYLIQILKVAVEYLGYFKGVRSAEIHFINQKSIIHKNDYLSDDIL